MKVHILNKPGNRTKQSPAILKVTLNDGSVIASFPHCERARDVIAIRAIWYDDPGSLDFLERFSGLKCLAIKAPVKVGTDFIAGLKSLRDLSVDIKGGYDPDFSCWPELKSIWLSSNSVCWKSMQAANKLTDCFIYGYRGTDLRSFAAFPVLSTLFVSRGSLQSLDGTKKMPELASLSLSHLSRLKDFTGLRDLGNLRILRVDTCKHLKSIDELAKLALLEEVELNNLGAIESLRPLRGLRRLRKVSLIESTSVSDGDTKLLEKLGVEFSFANRRHYNFNYNHLKPQA